MRATKSAPNDILYGALKLHQPEAGCGPRVNIDTILLADYVRAAHGARIVEMGCAQGAISLILAMRRRHRQCNKPGEPPPVIDAFDINPELIALAAENARLNDLQDDVAFAVADLKAHRDVWRAETYDVVVMNPPYDEPGRSRPAAGAAMNAALHGAACTLGDVLDAAKYLLKNGGRLYLVIRAKRLGELFTQMNVRNIRPKRMTAVHPKPDREASVVLVEGVRAAGDGIAVQPPIFVHDADGAYTERLLAAYRMEDEPCR